MLKVGLLGVLLSAPASGDVSPNRDLVIRSVVRGGVDTNAEQSSRARQRAVTAMDIDLTVAYERDAGEHTFAEVEAEVGLNWFGGDADASRLTLLTSLAWGRRIAGSLEAEVGLGYGFAIRIDDRPDPPRPVWTRRLDGGVPPRTDLTDDDVFDPDRGLAGPAIAFSRPLHEVTLYSRWRWRPRSGTRVRLIPQVGRVLQAGESGRRRRHYAEPGVSIDFRQRLWSRLRLEGAYRFEWRTHDERRDQSGGVLRLSTHRTEWGLSHRSRRWRWRLRHDFRFRSASGGGTRTRRHGFRAELSHRFDERFSIVSEIRGVFQNRLDRSDRDWHRWIARFGIAVRF
ncbi:MAG: hypothetical protein AAF449_02945 [Myxococcota bacterium]